MGGRELPVLDLGPFRRYPTRAAEQEFEDERQVCSRCVSGVCCANQDAIFLNTFDILRLSAFFNMSAGDFMLTFTQDEFEDDEYGWRRMCNADPKSSVVTWLRRRGKSAASPCIFLKYIREPDGTPRRVCSVHDARPLGCREFYFPNCKARGTGELATLLAAGFEKVRDGEITGEMADARLAQFGKHDFRTEPLAKSLEYGFWVEIKCATDIEGADLEGANSYDISRYQDPIDEKLNRLLSSRNLRDEESFGLRPRDEQLIPYTSGRGFAGSAEFKRIIHIARTPPSKGLFEQGHYPYYVASRTMFPGAKPSRVFQTIPRAEISSFLRQIPLTPLFPNHDLTEVRAITQKHLYSAVLKGYNHLIRVSSHIAALDPLLAADPPGTIERALLSIMANAETSLNPYLARNRFFVPIVQRMAESSISLMEEEIASAGSPMEVFACLRHLCEAQTVVHSLPADLQRRLRALRRRIMAQLRKDSLKLYVPTWNSILKRRKSGRSPGPTTALKNWTRWSEQIRDIRYAATAGFQGVDLRAFYTRSVNELEKIPLKRNYEGRLFRIATCLGYGMTSNNRIACKTVSYREAADRLVLYTSRLFDWSEARGVETADPETIAGLATAVYKGLGVSYNQHRCFGLILRRVLDAQQPDGSWGTDFRPSSMPEDQAQFWERTYRSTGACIDALRPLRNDVLNFENAALGLA